MDISLQKAHKMAKSHVKGCSTSLLAQMVKNLPAVRETQVWSLGQEVLLEKGMATHYSILSWWIPWAEEPDGLLSMESHRVGHNWATNTFASLFIREMQIKTKMMCQLTQVRMAIIKKPTNKFWRRYGEKTPFYTVEQESKLHWFSCVWLCDCSPPGSSVHGILQTRIWEWVVMPSFMGSSQPRAQPRSPASPALLAILYYWATGEAPYTIGGNVNCCSHNGEQYEGSFKN